MLWYKSWLETRSRFLIGLVLLIVMACGTVFDYVAVQKLMPLTDSIGASTDTSGSCSRSNRSWSERNPRSRSTRRF